MGETNSGAMPQNVAKYVYMGTMMINIVLFSCQIFQGLLFWKYEADVLLYYDIIAVFAFIFACIMLKKRKVWTYLIIIFAGIFCFMVLAVLYLGWEYGFQQYCIGFVASLIFTDFYMNRERKITKRTIIIVVFNVLLYIALRLWTYEHPYIYKLDSEWLARGFYITNSLIGFTFLITYSFIYSSTVRKLENTLLEMANIDPLTGICNRRKMQQMLKLALEGYENNEAKIVIAMLDVDYFKKINDTYGHDVGDEVLIKLGKILHDKQENNDGFHVSRWGGEEFLVFYEGYKENKENIVCEFDDLRKQIETTIVESKTKDICVTVTIGLAFYEKGKTMHSLIKEADDNLYSGKNSGRNKVVV